jgi:hypothetical protein
MIQNQPFRKLFPLSQDELKEISLDKYKIVLSDCQDYEFDLKRIVSGQDRYIDWTAESLDAIEDLMVNAYVYNKDLSQLISLLNSFSELFFNKDMRCLCFNVNNVRLNIELAIIDQKKYGI